MKWRDFEKMIKAKNITLFTPRDVQKFLHRSKIATRFLIHRLKKQGLIARLKQGLYKLTDEHVPDFYIANKLYEPSYISLEFALSYHGIIPEAVYEITSVTTKATRSFDTLDKTFSYRRIKRKAFAGYIPQKQNDFTFLVAEPEKAFVDLCYLRLRQNQKLPDRIRKEKINLKHALHYAKLFDNKKLINIINTSLK